MRNKVSLETFKLIQLALFCAAFLILYFILSSNNRFFADDFYYLQTANEHGVWKGMVVVYNSWVTRWAALLLLSSALKVSDFFHSALSYHILTVMTVISMMTVIIRVALTRFLQVKMSFVSLVLYAVLFTASFFFFSFDIGEIWFWITSSAMYLWSIIFFIAGSALIIQSRNNWWSKISCCSCFLFIGGSSESVAIAILIILLAGTVYNFIQCNYSFKSFWNHESSRLFFIALTSLIISILISYEGNGRTIRQADLPDTGILKALFISCKSLVKLILFQLPLKIHWFIFFAVPWIYLGSLFSSEEKESLEKIFKKIIGFIFAFLLISFISFVPVSLLLGETGPFRTWILVSFYLSLCCAVCGFYLGYKASWNKKMLNRVVTISLSTLTLLMILNILEQKEITTKYAAAVDQRMSYLFQQKAKNEKNMVALDPLPSSGMLYSTEISEDTNYFSNLHLKNYLKAEFSIRKR